MVEARLEESDTEDEPLLTDKEYQESLKWHFGEMKEASASKKKTIWEILKRVFVGFFFLSTYINSYLVNTFTMALVPIVLEISVQSELL